MDMYGRWKGNRRGKSHHVVGLEDQQLAMPD